MKSLPFKVCLLSLLLFIYNCTEDSPSNPPPNLTIQEKFQKALDDGIKEYNGKGISVAIIMPDGEMWTGTSGISSEGVPIESDMLFSAGSITKMFTACTILQLAEEGTLSLQDSIHRWLPQYPNIDNNITIKQLLNHTNGIRDIVEHPDLIQSIINNPSREWTLEEVLQNYTMEPYFAQGTNWHYSNTGYLLLRMLIKEATESTISTNYRNRFFQPLGMTKSFTAPEEEGQDIAQAWLDLNNDGSYDKLPFLTSFYSVAGGGVFCTASDLATWVHSVLHDRNVVSENMYSKMIEFYSPCPNEPLVEGYGLGVLKFSPELFNNLNALGHGGNALGYAAACIYLPDYNVCMAIMDNTEEGESMFIINDLLKIIIENLN